METKGVASVRSPVHNLRQFKEDVTHVAFIDGVVRTFREEYKIDTEVFGHRCIHTIKTLPHQLGKINPR